MRLADGFSLNAGLMVVLIFFFIEIKLKKKNGIPNERKIMVEKWGVFLIDQRLYPNKPVQAISNCYYPLLTLFIWKMIANMIIQVVYNCRSILLSINISASEDNGHDVIQEKKMQLFIHFFFQFTFIVYHLFLQSLCKSCADFEYLVSNLVNDSNA